MIATTTPRTLHPFEVGKSYDREAVLAFVGSRQPVSGIVYSPDNADFLAIFSGGRGSNPSGQGSPTIKVTMCSGSDVRRHHVDEAGDAAPLPLQTSPSTPNERLKDKRPDALLAHVVSSWAEVVRMRQLPNDGDDRNKGWCVYCGGSDDTRDHVPSRVLLDEPFPENLPVVPACARCNNSFSRDEEYLACFVECAITGSVAGATGRPKVAAILERSEGLASRLTAFRSESDGQVGFSLETDRVRNVLVKLARGHAAFEQNEPQLDEPGTVSFAPLTSMDERQRTAFESAGANRGLWPEVGSRAMHRVLMGGDLGPGGWIEVQPDRYRYRVHSGGRRVQLVIREYLAAEVTWD